MDNHLAGWPITIKIPVQWGDLDAFQHVNNTVYLRWFESSRIAFTRKLGLWELLEKDGIGPILASTRIDYRRPLMFPDTVEVGSKTVKVGRTSLTLEHRVVGLASNVIAAEGVAVIVLYDYKKAEPTPIPESIRQRIETIEGPGTEATQ